ncbi:MAG: hypothetical protein WAZ27_00355 [Minisyncoccia bacterium]
MTGNIEEVYRFQSDIPLHELQVVTDEIIKRAKETEGAAKNADINSNDIRFEKAAGYDLVDIVTARIIGEAAIYAWKTYVWPELKRRYGESIRRRNDDNDNSNA